MPNYRADEWAAWEVDPSTRTSVHAFTKYVPINATVATSVDDLLTVSRGLPSVNLVTNPSLEVNTLTAFTASGAVISQSNAVTAATGTYSLLVNPDNAAAGEGFYWTGTFSGHPEGSWLVASAEVRGASASGSVKIVVQDSTGEVELAASAAHSLTTSFAKISIMYTLPIHAPADYRVAVVSAVNHNITWYTDKIHVEERRDGQVADYVDGAQGINYEWAGTANASVSKRRAGISVIRGLRLKNDGSNPVYIAFDATASAIAPFTGIQIVAGEIFETNFPIDFRTNISAIATGGTSAIHGVVWGLHQG